MKILVIGNSTRSIVCSAKKAGYTVYSLDRFGDVDMRLCSERFGLLETGITDKKIYELARSFGDVEAVILGPGFENLKFKNILNNRLSVMEEVNDKLKIAKKFSSLGIPHPHSESLDLITGAKFPLMIKPRFGAGGMLNVIVRNEDELEDLKAKVRAGEYIAQEFVEGIPCSASLIGTGDDAAVVALNEQLIGVTWLTRLPFAYCGNITPFCTEFSREMIQYAEQIALEFGLVGSNGVDFIVTKKGAVVIEVNPRFQGSLDTVEFSTGTNLFAAHVKSFTGRLPEPLEPACFAAKAIVYADKKYVVEKKLSDMLIKCMEMKRAVDVPQSGCVVQPDEPVTALLETGRTRQMAFEKVSRYARRIKLLTEG